MTYDLGLAGMTLLAAISVWLAPILVASVVTGIAAAIRTLERRLHDRPRLEHARLGGARLDRARLDRAHLDPAHLDGAGGRIYTAQRELRRAAARLVRGT